MVFLPESFFFSWQSDSCNEIFLLSCKAKVLHSKMDVKSADLVSCMTESKSDITRSKEKKRGTETNE